MCARLLCLSCLLWLTACERQHKDVTSIITEPRCPSFAKVPEPDSDGECQCGTGLWPHIQLPSGGVERQGSSYWKWDCTDCLCLPGTTPNIEIGGDYAFIENAGRIVVTRQGKTLTEISNISGESLTYSLADYLHQEVVVSAFAPGCSEGDACSRYGVGFVEKPVFPRRSNLCGVGLFTKHRLFCSKLGVAGSGSVANTVTATMNALRAPKVIDRGFGLEFELVSRSVPKQIRDAVKNAFKFRVQAASFNGIMALTRWYLRRQNQTDTIRSLEKMGFSDMDTLLEKSGALNLPALEECFVNSTKSPEDLGTPCSKHSDCALTQYCMDCEACKKQKSGMLPVKAWEAAKSWLPLSRPSFLPDVTLCNGCPSHEAKVCQKRSACEEGLPAGGGACPTALKAWQWTLDPSVHALSAAEAKTLSPHGDREDEGAGFELVSPPLAGEEGMRSALEVLQVLRGMGIQAGTSSGMHVHVNVASSKVPGSILSPTKIANVWVAFAKYQLVIDEMLSPSRLGNHYARRLFLGQCAGSSYGSCDENPCACAQRFFKQIHAYVHDAKQIMTGTVADFCNAALSTGEDHKPCEARYPDVRYYALNLVPLSRLGTIEFRAHSATHDPERLQRWTQFVVAFVEHFGVDVPSAAKPFFDGNAEEDLAELAEAQRKATSDELFEALKDKLSPGFKEYFASRPWEDDAPGCDVTDESGLDEKASLDRFHKDHEIANLLGEQISTEVEPGPDGDE